MMRRAILPALGLALAAATVAAPSLAAQQDQPIRRGQAVPGTLTGTSEHTYALDLDGDRFVFGEVDQHTVDVEVTILGPDGKELASFDTPSRGPEVFTFESDEPGTYTIRVTPFEEQSGDYTLLVRRVERVATDREDRVDQLMAPFSGSETPGAVVAVMEGGEIEYVRAFGMANLEHDIPFTDETLSNIGSVTKQFTAMGILLLQADGKLSLDDDVRTHIPELPDFGEPVTLRNLLNHTSGYREFYNFLPMAGFGGEDAVNRDMAITIVQRQPELQNRPNTEFNYNNTGFILLATTIERVSGMSFPDYMEARVFRPLGMTNTLVKGYQGQIIPGSAQGYVPADGGGYRTARDLAASYGAGGIYMTAQDMARWMTNYRDATLGGPDAVQAIVTPGVLENGDSTGYGLGMGVRTRNGQRLYTHTGGDTAHRTYFAYLPDLDGGVFVSSNNAVFSTAIGVQVMDLFFADDFEAEEQESGAGEGGDAEVTIPAARMEAMAGDWVLDARGQPMKMEFRVEDGEMVMTPEGQSARVLRPTSDSTFAVEEVSAVISFTFASDGSTNEATLFQNGPMPMRRASDDSVAAPDLGSFEGRYYSRELEVFYDLKVVDGDLMMHHLGGAPMKLSHRDGERFGGPFPFVNVEFVRTANGGVTGFRAGNDRTRDVLFEKR